MAFLAIPDFEASSGASATVASIAVAVGDAVIRGELLLELELDKAIVEVPAETDGTVTDIMVSIGDVVERGQPFIEVQSHERVAVESVNDTSVKEDRARGGDAPIPEREQLNVASHGNSPTSFHADRQNRVAQANPRTRRLARELGIELNDVTDVGMNGRITDADVKRYAGGLARRAVKSVYGVGNRSDHCPLPNHCVRRSSQSEPMSRISIATGKNLLNAWSRIPHAWLRQDADITEMEAWHRNLNGNIRKEEIQNLCFRSAQRVDAAACSARMPY